MRLRLLAPLLASFVCAPTGMGADFRLFLPRPLQNGAWVDFNAIYESDDLSGGAGQTFWSDILLKERVTVFSNGYVYHPRFLTYYVSLTEAFKQENYDSSFAPSQGFRRRTSFEYDTKIVLLPEHPYHLELFARRYEPLYRETYATPPDTIALNRGADFRYRRKPWFFRARFTDDATESTQSWSDVRRLDLGGTYFKELEDGKILSFDAAYTPAKVSNSGGLEGRMTDASVGNTLDLGRYRLVSSLTSSDQSQEGGAAVRSKSSQLTWLERFGADLPGRLRADLTWRYQASDAVYSAVTGYPERTLDSVRRSLEADLNYQVYESLQPLYAFRYDSGSSSGGSSSSLGNSLTLLYTKKVPGGRLLASLYGGQVETESQGQTEVVEEVHAAVSIPGAFLLDRPSADPFSVVVFVRSPQAPFELLQLVENVNYMVAVVGNSLQVTVLGLPPQFAVPGSYEFRVSYSLTGGDFRMRSRNFGESLSLALFDNLVTPYVRYASVRSTVLSGVAPAGGLDSDIFAAGVSLFKGPLRGRVEYQDVRWAISPYHGWRAEIQYIGALSRTTNTNCTAVYEDRSFEETFGEANRPTYSETITSVSGSIQQYIFQRTLSLSAGGTYARVLGLTDSSSYGLNATLGWRVGKLDLSAGASYTSSDTAAGTGFSAQRTHQLYYLRLRRTIL